MKDVLFPVLAFVLGAAVEFVNFLLTSSALRKKKDALMIFPLRTVIAAGFLILLYFAAKALGLNVTACMIAGAVGASAGLAVFSMLLMKDNKKGGDRDG